MDHQALAGFPPRLRAGCKINLGLRIVGRRSDGWHELDTLFVALPAPWDELRFRLRPEDGAGLRLCCATPGIDPERNTLSRAFARYAAATGFGPALDVELIKGVPMGAGLGGGSADAAALLLALQEGARQAASGAAGPLSAVALNELAAEVGADVPFFLRAGISREDGSKTPPDCVPTAGAAGQVWRATGIGENLAPAALPVWAQGRGLLLLCPKVHVATPWAFAAWDAAHLHPAQEPGLPPDQPCRPSPPHSLGQTDANLARTAFSGLTRSRQEAIDSFLPQGWLENSFEPVVFARFPELSLLKTDMFRQGALAAAMSGSGASLFGLFADARAARKACGVFSDRGVTAFWHPLGRCA